jgi:uncharacterized protein
MEISYFFDTYAFIEIIKQNKNYSKYIKEITIITTKLNLMELHYILLRTFGKQKADFYYDRFLPFAIDISDEVIKKANEFKLRNKSRNLSYVDCIGYILSRINCTKFLTGDKEFEGVENVEFVK